MKKLKWLVVVCLIGLISLVFAGTPVHAANGSEYYAYEINSLDVVMDVQEDGKINVSETYVVNFKVRSQGLRRDIPEDNEFRGEINGEYISKDFYLPVSNVKSNFPLELDSEDGQFIIKMIDRDEYLNGIHTFELSYTVDNKDLSRLGYSMFYQDMVTNTFETTINQSSFTINFPKTFDKNEVYAYSGLYGNAGNEKMDVTVNGNQVKLTSKDVLYARESVTLQVNLPEDYFVYPLITTQNGLLIGVSIGSILLTLFAIFVVAGKKEEVVVVTNFSAPYQMTSGQVGKLLLNPFPLSIPAMLIEWANKGLLAFHEIVDEEKPNKKPEMWIEVLKDGDSSKLLAYEQIIFDKYFANVKENEENKKMISLKTMESKDAFDSYSSARNSLTRVMKGLGYEMFTGKSIFAAVLLGLNLIMIPVMVAYVLSSYYYITQGILWLLMALIVNILLSVGLLVSRISKYTNSKLSNLIFGAVSVVWLIVTVGIVFLLQSVNFSIIAITVYVIASLLLMIADYQVLRSSKKSANMIGELLGFKEYIEMVEMDSLKVSIEEQPDLFFKVLPYAYMFGLTDLWISKFKSLDNIQPSWYHTSGSTTFMYWYWYSMYTTNMTRMVSQSRTFVDPKSIGSGSGGGSFGGGFGGGGFSGGGFGGGGGGRL